MAGRPGNSFPGHKPQRAAAKTVPACYRKGHAQAGGHITRPGSRDIAAGRLIATPRSVRFWRRCCPTGPNRAASVIHQRRPGFLHFVLALAVRIVCAKGLSTNRGTGMSKPPARPPLARSNVPLIGVGAKPPQTKTGGSVGRSIAKS